MLADKTKRKYTVSYELDKENETSYELDAQNMKLERFR